MRRNGRRIGRIGLHHAAASLALSAALASALRAQAPNPGREAFRSHCSACHGLDGRGGEHGPDIVTTPEVRALPDAELARVISNGVPRAGMPSFKRLLSPEEVRAVVSYLRGAGSRGVATKLPGDPRQGGALFFGKARCGECHTVRGQGGFLGADLSDYGRDHSADQIREAILHPNGADGPNGHNPRGRETVVATARTGEHWTAIVLDEDNFSLQLLDQQGRFHLLTKSELASVERQARSLMPDDYGSRLSPAEIDALVAYLAVRVGPRM